VDDQEIRRIVDEAIRARSGAQEGQRPNPAPTGGGNGASSKPRAGSEELPEEWELVEERVGESYRWPKGDEHYESFRVFEGSTSRGTVRLALAEHAPIEQRGGLRKYYVVFHVTSGSKRPLVVFQATDDYEERGDELVAIIRGREGGRKMYGPTDTLPEAYDGFRVEEFNERISGPGSLHKLAVVAREDDEATMLAHGYLQARLRFGLEPS
jgi:hypothetical protein